MGILGVIVYQAKQSIGIKGSNPSGQGWWCYFTVAWFFFQLFLFGQVYDACRKKFPTQQPTEKWVFLLIQDIQDGTGDYPSWMSERLRKACAKYLWMDGKSGSTGLPPIFPVPRYEGPVAPHMFYVRKVVVMEWIYKQPWVTLTFQVGRTAWNSFRTVSDCTLFWSPLERTRIGRRVMLDQLKKT